MPELLPVLDLDLTRPLATSQWESSTSLSVPWTDKDIIYLANEDAGTFDTLGATKSYHALIVGGTRAGKGTSFLIPNLLLWEGSAFVIDPKGENACLTARRRGKGSQYCKGMGQDVYLLDPFGVASRPDDDFANIIARYNPLDAIDVNTANAVDLVNALCSAIVTIPEQGDSALWKVAARRLLKAVILHVLTSEDFSTEDRNLVTVYKLLGFGDQEKQDFLEFIGADQIPSAHTLLYQAMAKNRAFGGMVAAEGDTYVRMSIDTPKQYMGVIETLKNDLEFMDSPAMQDTLSVSDFSLSDFKDNADGITVYLSLPLSMMETHFHWLRMILALSLNTFEMQKHQPQSGQPTMMMLDEFASLKRMPQLENGIAQMAGYGVKFILAVQNLPQLKHIYKDGWENFISNCGTKIFLSNEDQTTREYISKLIGEAEITRTTTTETVNGGTSFSTSSTQTDAYGHSSGTSFNNGPGLFSFSSGRNRGTSQTTSFAFGKTESENSGWSTAKQQAIHIRPLVRPSEIGRFFAYIDEPDGLPYAGHNLVLLSGQQPFAVRKTLYYRHLRFEGLFDPHPDHPFQLAYRPPVITLEPLPEPIRYFEPPKPWWMRCLLFLISRMGLLWVWLPMALAGLVLFILIETGLIVDVALLLLAILPWY